MGKDTGIPGTAPEMFENRGFWEGLKRYRHLGHYSPSACLLLSPLTALTSDQLGSVDKVPPNEPQMRYN